MNNSVVYIDYNFEDSKYKNKPEDGNAYYTFGFGSLYARQFKKENSNWEVQCWKADKYAKSSSAIDVDGVKHIIFPAIKIPRAGFISSFLMKHAKQYLNENPRTVFNVSSFDHLLHYQISSLGNRCPVFVQHHGESPAKHKLKTSTGIKNLYWKVWKLIEKKAFSRTYMVYLLDGVAADYLPIEKNKFKVRTTGVDAEMFVPSDKLVAKELLKLKPELSYLIFIGRLNASKRADMLIDVFLRLQKEIPLLGLIIGGCQESDPLYKKAKNAGAVITGMIPQDEVSLWLSAADVYSLPLLDTAHVFGGIGMLPVQAMLCNTPAVGSTIKCFPENKRNETGIFTQTEDELYEAIKSILFKKREFPNTRETTLIHYAWSSIVLKTTEDYLQALDLKCRD